MIYLSPFKLLLELVVDMPNCFLFDFNWLSYPDFLKDVVIEATELDIFLFLELEEVNPSFLIFSTYCELVGVLIWPLEFTERIISKINDYVKFNYI